MLRRTAAIFCLALAAPGAAEPEGTAPAREVSAADAQELRRASELSYVDPPAALAIYRQLIARVPRDAIFPDCEDGGCTFEGAALPGARIAECLVARGLPPRFAELDDLIAALQAAIRAAAAPKLRELVPCELEISVLDSCNVASVDASRVMEDILAQLPKIELNGLPRETPGLVLDYPRIEISGEHATLYFASTPEQTLDFLRAGGSWRWSGYGTEDREVMQRLEKAKPPRTLQ